MAIRSSRLLPPSFSNELSLRLEFSGLGGDQLRKNRLGISVVLLPYIEIPEVVDAVLGLLALAVELTLFWPVTLRVTVDVDLDHLAVREEVVADALFQGAGTAELAETGDAGHALRLLRCRREADPGGRGEVFRYPAPYRIVGGAAPVAFIDRDRVEKAGENCRYVFRCVFGLTNARYIPGQTSKTVATGRFLSMARVM